MDGHYDFLDSQKLKDLIAKGEWIAHNSAILVFHGIGHHKPIDTLDTFVRGILGAYEANGIDPSRLKLSHRLSSESEGDEERYITYVRLEYEGSEFYLDCYEYYWAFHSEDKVSWGNIQEWIETLSSGAKEFYEERSRSGLDARDESLFFTKGKFNRPTYKLFISMAGVVLPILGSFFSLFGFVRFIPVVGYSIHGYFERKENKFSRYLTNLFGDIVAYNSPDPKDRFYAIRKNIQKMAAQKIQFLIESRNPTEGYKYDKIVIIAHSLGTQIAFDGLNRIDRMGACGGIKRENLEKVLGFVTFGSHLDKAAFFFTEQTSKDEYIKEQVQKNLYTFKTRQPLGDTPPYLLQKPLHSTLSSIRWRNYYDANDPVSGHLDYYDGVENIKCNYEGDDTQDHKGLLYYIKHLYPFTHGRYWEDKRVYSDIILGYLHHC
jgi:hypothetical protein